MKIKLKEDPKNIALIKAMGSRDEDTSKEALKIFAALVGPVALPVINESDEIGALYEKLEIGEYEPRTIPLDDFYDVDEAGYYNVSMMSKPGDLSYNMTTGSDDIAVATMYILSAVAMNKKYLRAGRVNHAEKAIKKLINEVIHKMKYNAVQPILDQLANAVTRDAFHIIRSTVANQVTLNDFNRLQTKVSRIVTSAMGGTPEAGVPRQITDMLASPEFVEQIRSIAYQPVNTRPGSETTSGATAIPAHEQLREQLFNQSGIPTLYNTNIVQLNEMGISEDYNTFFDEYAGTNEYEGYNGAGTAVFDAATEEFVLCINRGIDNLLQVNIRDGETDETFNTRPDNQFVERERKVGFYGEQEVGYIALGARNLFGLIW